MPLFGSGRSQLSKDQRRQLGPGTLEPKRADLSKYYHGAQAARIEVKKPASPPATPDAAIKNDDGALDAPFGEVVIIRHRSPERVSPIQRILNWASNLGSSVRSLLVGLFGKAR